jgi:hypothetical protein
MISELSAAFSTAQASVGLLKTLLSATQDEKVRNAVFEIQNDLLSLQSKLFEANARFEEQSAKLVDLQRQLDERDRWDETKAKHKIVELYEGRYAYKLCSPSGDIEDKLRYCVTCFESRKLSLLQERGNNIGVYECPVCKHLLAPPYTQQGPPKIKMYGHPSTRKLSR